MGHDSHGVGMIPAYVTQYHKGLLIPNQPAKLVQDSGPILQFDGQRGYGQRVAREATAAACQRAKQLGVVLLTVRNSCHMGRYEARVFFLLALVRLLRYKGCERTPGL